MYKKEKGFTLVELIVVMAIIAILTLMAVPRIQKYIKNAKAESVLASAQTIYKAALAYEADHITVPNSIRTRGSGYLINRANATQYNDTGFWIYESLLTPYINGDVLFTGNEQQFYRLNDTEIYNMFYAGTLNDFNYTFKEPIVIYYNDPRFPNTEEINQNYDKLHQFQYTYTALINGVPTVVEAWEYPGAIPPYHMVPVSEYLTEYKKALAEIN